MARTAMEIAAIAENRFRIGQTLNTATAKRGRHALLNARLLNPHFLRKNVCRLKPRCASDEVHRNQQTGWGDHSRSNPNLKKEHRSMRKLITRKRAIALGAVGALALVAAAVAYFTT